MKTMLLDADIVAYKFAAAAQQIFEFEPGEPVVHVSDLADVIAEMDAYIEDLKQQLAVTRVVACLSCPSGENFRVSLYPLYKANRKDTVRPVLLPELREYIKTHYDSYLRPMLEGDDVIGILATSERLIPGDKVVVSEDKDLRQIPGWLFNPRQMLEPELISHEEADRFFFTQVLTGDPTDNYPGCPGIGAVKAKKLLDGAEEPWTAIVAAYALKGLTEQDALVQARMARILRNTDYDYKNRRPKPWIPETAATAPTTTRTPAPSTTPPRTAGIAPVPA